MKRVLVTGSSGEIGSALVAALLRSGDVDLVGGIDLRGPAATHARFHFVRRDIAQPCTDLLHRYAIDTVVHAAYPVEPSHSPAGTGNTACAGTRAVVESARSGGVQNFLHLSSATVYGAYPGNSALRSEDASLRPNQGFAYGQHKAAAEAVLHQCAGKEMFASLVVLRPSFVVGAGTANALMRHLCRSLVPLPSTQAPLQFVHRDDLVRIVLDLLRQNVSGTFNVGAAGGLTASEMVRRLGQRPLILRDRVLTLMNEVAWRARLPLAPAPAAALDLLRYPWRVDSTSLKRLLPRAFRYTSEEAFQSFAEAALLAARRR